MANNNFTDFSQFAPMDFHPWAEPRHSSLFGEPGDNGPGAAGLPPAAAPIPSAVLGSGPNANVGGILMPTPKVAPLPGMPNGLPSAATGRAPLSRAGKIREAIIGHAAGDMPHDYEGLAGLTKEDIMAERPSLLQSLFPAEGQPHAAQRWTQNLDKLVQRRTLGAQAQAEQQLKTARAAIQQRIGPAPEDTDGFRKWAHRAYGMYASIGDVPSLERMNVVMQQVLAGENQKQEAANKPKAKANTSWQTIDDPKNPAKDVRALVDDETGDIVRQYSASKDTSAADQRRYDSEHEASYRHEQGLADDYNKDTKTFRELGLVIGGALKEVPLALKGEGTSQTNLLYAFVHAMDPQSAVREGEIGLVRSAASLRAQAQQMIDKYVKSGESQLVPQRMITLMGELMARRMKYTTDYVDERRNYYIDRGKRWNVDPSAFKDDLAVFKDNKAAGKAPDPYAAFGVQPVIATRKP